MPSRNPFLVPPLAGTPEYGAWLDELRARSGAASRSRLVEQALAELGRKHGLEPPRRVNPVGTNQHGEPRRGG